MAHHAQEVAAGERFEFGKIGRLRPFESWWCDGRERGMSAWCDVVD